MTILACNVCGALVEVDPTDAITPRCITCGSGEIYPVYDDDEKEGST